MRHNPVKKRCLNCGRKFADTTKPKNRKSCSKYCADEVKKEKQRREYRINNPRPKLVGRKIAMRMALQRRIARQKNLPNTLTTVGANEILTKFKNKCAITGDGNYHMDHVIPISAGHGGTVYGNMIPLRADLNISKSDRNIFDWFADNRERFGLEQRKFDELIEYLADINGMTTQEYEEYVRRCHDNPRTVDEVIDEQARA